MASYKDILRAIRQGQSPREIIEQLRLSPSRAQRLLKCKALKRHLRMEEQIAAMMVSHETAAAAHLVSRKLLELLDSGSAETTRKACLALLNEATQHDEPDGKVSSSVNPAAVLKPLTGPAARPFAARPNARPAKEN